ncbi:hypothetical protein L3Y34_015061 [Caenorhabditis briggsae]|nr:hypothetical protein L3Y34_015061 [Caenorhabditis briggsae]
MMHKSLLRPGGIMHVPQFRIDKEDVFGTEKVVQTHGNARSVSFLGRRKSCGWQLWANVTPKMHFLLEHTVELAISHRSIASEQSLEAIHRALNRIKLRYSTVPHNTERNNRTHL